MAATDDGKTQGALLFSLDQRSGGGAGGLALRALALDTAELFSIGENKVHVLVEREHLAGHLTAVVERGAHAVVNQVLHLSLLVALRHDWRGACEHDFGSDRVDWRGVAWS